jgi:starch synthase
MAVKLKIASIASEVAPFSKTGGLADVARSLPKALKRLGHDVIVITPLYGKMIDSAAHHLKLIASDIKISLDDKESISVNFWQGYLMKGLPVYFVEQKKYFSQKKTIYDYNNNNVRFYIFNIAAIKLLQHIKYQADIVHCHDWQTGLIPYLLKTEHRQTRLFAKTKTVYTIHNLVFQMGRNWWEVPAEKKDFGKKKLPSIHGEDFQFVNFAKRGILHADLVNTVSEQYREEIMTKHFGQDLDKILRSREESVFGIINGIDSRVFNPSADKSIFKNYDYRKIHRKKLNKEYIQEELGLPVDGDIPLFCSTSRLTFQKGFQLITAVLDKIMRHDIQLVILGTGEKGYIKDLKLCAKRYPKKLLVIPSHEQTLKYENQVYAGADFFLLPSHHEPCGINQLKAMRYGCIPIVRRVGGLHDTVKNYNPATGAGTGFSFLQFDEWALFEAIIRALEAKKHKQDWRDLVVRAMKESNSWELPAKKYILLYKKALQAGK